MGTRRGGVVRIRVISRLFLVAGFIITLSVMLVGCPGFHRNTIRGYARLDAPLVGATVRFFREDGACIRTMRNATGPRGTHMATRRH